jgi:hypothetical protein
LEKVAVEIFRSRGSWSPWIPRLQCWRFQIKTFSSGGQLEGRKKSEAMRRWKSRALLCVSFSCFMNVQFSVSPSSSCKAGRHEPVWVFLFSIFFSGGSSVVWELLPEWFR